MEENNLSKETLEKVKREFGILYELSNLMRTTLNLNQILYIILTALTSHEGLGFNRAMLFLVNGKTNILEGIMGIGPHSGEEADKIWQGIERQKLTMEDIINSYERFRINPESKLNSLVKGIKVPLEKKGGILALTILDGTPFEITSSESQKKVDPDIKIKLKTESFVTIPLKSKDKVLGVILVDNLFTRKPITKSDIRVLTMFANHAGLAIENSRLYEKSLLLAKIDWLTKLWNSGEFHKRLSISIGKAKISETPLTLVMLDMDNFKVYNDTYGHQKGNEAIRDIARILTAKSRRGDIVARYGGEEFAMIMPFTEKEDAKMISERLRVSIEKFFAGKLGPKNKMPLTASIGIATFPQDATDRGNLITCADSALYEAKRTGKNRTCIYQSDLKRFFGRLARITRKDPEE